MLQLLSSSSRASTLTRFAPRPKGPSSMWWWWWKPEERSIGLCDDDDWLRCKKLMLLSAKAACKLALSASPKSVGLGVMLGLLDWIPPEVDLCGRRLWNSTSSTVQTAPLTFSTRMKHLCSDRLWRTAFYHRFVFVWASTTFSFLLRFEDIPSRNGRHGSLITLITNYPLYVTISWPALFLRFFFFLRERPIKKKLKRPKLIRPQIINQKKPKKQQKRWNEFGTFHVAALWRK